MATGNMIDDDPTAWYERRPDGLIYLGFYEGNDGQMKCRASTHPYDAPRPGEKFFLLAYGSELEAPHVWPSGRCLRDSSSNVSQ